MVNPSKLKNLEILDFEVLPFYASHRNTDRSLDDGNLVLH